MKHKISAKKLKEVEEIKNLSNKYSVIGLIDMTNLPSLQLQRMRQQLRSTLFLKMTKKRLIRIGLEQLKEKENIKEFSDQLRGEAALIFTNDSPFKLAKVLNKGKSNAPAKVGQIAPNDIIIPAGPTSFAPGPVIGELGQLGIKTEVKEGKIAIKEDKLLVREGEIINQKAADMLYKLGVEPMKVGLNLVAAYEKGIIYTKDVLSVDEEAYINNIKQMGMDAFNLAIHIGYITKDNVKQLIQKAFRDSSALSDSKNITTSESIKGELAKVDMEADALKNKLNIETIEEVKEEKKKLHKEVNMEKEKEVTTDELLNEAEEDTKEEREQMIKERKEKEDMKKAEDALKELTDKAIRGKK